MGVKRKMNNLFELCDFVSHSGLKLDWKINCNALTDNDYKTLAYIIFKKYSFKDVVSIPTGGNKLRKFLIPYKNKNSPTILIVDDVLTTGKSMLKEMAKYPQPKLGLVIFARGKLPLGVYSIFSLC